MGAQRAKAECIVAFSEADAGVIEHQRAVIKRRWLEFEGAVEEKLAGGGKQEVSAADDLGDLHGGIVRYHGELVGGNIIGPPDDKVAEVLAGDELLRAEMAVGKGDNFAIGHAESPTELG